jgi:hypothetical protein
MKELNSRNQYGRGYANKPLTAEGKKVAVSISITGSFALGNNTRSFDSILVFPLRYWHL